MVYLLTDNILFSSKIVQNLKGHGVETRTFMAAEPMLAALEQDAPTAILVNLSAKAYDPVETIRTLKGGHAATPVVAFCGHTDEAAQARGREAGADRVVANSAITMNARQTLRDAGVDV